MRLALALGLCAVAASLHAQAAGASRLAEGRLLRPLADGKPVPLSGTWVVLHRVGSDRAAPLDSVKSGANGRFRLRYQPFGAEDALYFVSARHQGIAYFSPPLRSAIVRGGDADVIVYDTTSDTTKLFVQGRHLVVSSPRGSRREIAEVFELENEGTRTVVPRDSVTPLWTARLPARAESASVAPGDVGAGAVEFRSGRAEVYAPISPGVRQLVLTYVMPADAFPFTRPVERAVSVFEVLLEEPLARVDGGHLDEVAAANIDGRVFRRFLAQDVPASAVLRVTAPPLVERNRTAMRVLFIVMGFAMLGALAAWVARRRRQPSAYALPSTSSAERAIAELAALDARFERHPVSREEYESQRAALKAMIARELAAEKSPV